jgi:DNA-binding transcriptional MerR regulator
MDESWKIGHVASQAGVTVDAVRFYERRGVLPQPRRRESGYRQYTSATVERIRFAKALQAIGFSLDDVVAVLRDVDAGIATCENEQPRFETVLARIDEKIAELTAVRRRLRQTLTRCRDGRCSFRETKPAASGRKARKTS